MSEDDIQEATLQEWAWKTPAMKAMTLAVCRLALDHSRAEFSAMDLPMHGELAQGGSGIAGSVFRQLVKTGIIAPVGTFDSAGAFYPKIVLNACKNKIGVYRLAKPGLCRALLAAHSPRQPNPPDEQLAFRLA
jgi:hypothetical protein